MGDPSLRWILWGGTRVHAHEQVGTALKSSAVCGYWPGFGSAIRRGSAPRCAQCIKSLALRGEEPRSSWIARACREQIVREALDPCACRAGICAPEHCADCADGRR